MEEENVGDTAKKKKRHLSSNKSDIAAVICEQHRHREHFVPLNASSCTLKKTMDKNAAVHYLGVC